MATIQNSGVHLSEEQKVREYYRTKKGLFGLISWDVVDKVEEVSRQVIINIPSLREIDSVFINGERVHGTPKSPTK